MDKKVLLYHNEIGREIQKLITENLPASTAGAMSDFIADAEKSRDCLVIAETTIKKQREEIESKDEKIKELWRQVSEIKAFKERDKDVTKQEEKLQVRERDIKLEIAMIQLDAANDRNNKIEQLVEKVFGHPSVEVSTTKNTPIMSGAENGCIPYETGRMTENENTKTTKIKT